MAATSSPRKSAPRKAPASTDDNFHHVLRNGFEVVLPPFNSVKPGVVRRIRKLSNVDQFFTVLEELSDKETLAEIDELEADEFEEVQRKWFEHSGIDLGEF